MIDWITHNWLSIFAILLSVIALIRSTKTEQHKLIVDAIERKNKVLLTRQRVILKSNEIVDRCKNQIAETEALSGYSEKEVFEKFKDRSIKEADVFEELIMTAACSRDLVQFLVKQYEDLAEIDIGKWPESSIQELESRYGEIESLAAALDSGLNKLKSGR